VTKPEIKRAGSCKYDLISLGEVMMRIAPGDVPMSRANAVRIWQGGGESNVAYGLSYCFGLETAVVTALVDDGVGQNIENQLRAAGIDTTEIVWFGSTRRCKHKTDNKGTICNGIHFTWRGKGVLPSRTEYYRAHSAARELKPGDVDWGGLMGQTRAFHCGGIYTLISPISSKVATEAYRQAKKNGVFCSFDLNYRSKVEPDRDKARAINREVIPYVDFLVGNQSDFYDCLGYETKVGEGAPLDQWLEAYTEMLAKVAGDFPNLKLIGTQLRAAHSADTISWGAVLYDAETGRISRAITRDNVEIADRTGGGDSFASGVIAGILKGKSVGESVEIGAAHGILVQQTPGDTTMVKEEDVLKEIKRAKEGKGVRALR